VVKVWSSSPAGTQLRCDGFRDSSRFAYSCTLEPVRDSPCDNLPGAVAVTGQSGYYNRGAVDILRCQVRTFAGNSYGSCAAEAKRFQIVHVEDSKPFAGTWAILLCQRHATDEDEEIGMNSNDELREHVRFLGAEPTF
jgi:hypothetical protein